MERVGARFPALDRILDFTKGGNVWARIIYVQIADKVIVFGIVTGPRPQPPSPPPT